MGWTWVSLDQFARDKERERNGSERNGQGVRVPADYLLSE